jgi:hypothetical protein
MYAGTYICSGRMRYLWRILTLYMCMDVCDICDVYLPCIYVYASVCVWMPLRLCRIQGAWCLNYARSQRARASFLSYTVSVKIHILMPCIHTSTHAQFGKSRMNGLTVVAGWRHPAGPKPTYLHYTHTHMHTYPHKHLTVGTRIECADLFSSGRMAAAGRSKAYLPTLYTYTYAYITQLEQE